jgi:hypothetical protein
MNSQTAAATARVRIRRSKRFSVLFKAAIHLLQDSAAGIIRMTAW